MASLVFDLDKPDSYHAWQDAGLPAPHWISVNRTNGHAHIGYMLATPVARTSAARQKPLRYLAAIEHVLAKRLGADMGYAGLITKNPTHSDWLTIWHQIEPYSLDYLAEFCPDADLAAYSRRSRKEATGLGRNVTVFDNVREWAYTAIRAHWRPNGYDAWLCAVQAACECTNVFGLEQGGPLPHSEIKATAKSIARWTWRNLTPSTFADYVDRTHTPEIQAVRGLRAGVSVARYPRAEAGRAKLLLSYLWCYNSRRRVTAIAILRRICKFRLAVCPTTSAVIVSDQKQSLYQITAPVGRFLEP